LESSKWRWFCGQFVHHRVADRPDVPVAVVVRAVVDEDLQVDADLVGGQAHALGRRAGWRTCRRSACQVVVEGRHVPALAVQHRIPDHGDRRTVPRSRDAASRASASVTSSKNSADARVVVVARGVRMVVVMTVMVVLTVAVLGVLLGHLRRTPSRNL